MEGCAIACTCMASALQTFDLRLDVPSLIGLCSVRTSTSDDTIQRYFAIGNSHYYTDPSTAEKASANREQWAFWMYMPRVAVVRAGSYGELLIDIDLKIGKHDAMPAEVLESKILPNMTVPTVATTQMLLVNELSCTFVSPFHCMFVRCNSATLGCRFSGLAKPPAVALPHLPRGHSLIQDRAVGFSQAARKIRPGTHHAFPVS